MAFHPYLFFGGNCEEAFHRYRDIFGGELFVMDVKDMPSDDAVTEYAAEGNLVLHAALTFGDNLLMGSDDLTATGPAFGTVHGMKVTYMVTEVDEAKRAFEALAEGGTVDEPMAETFFS